MVKLHTSNRIIYLYSCSPPIAPAVSHLWMYQIGPKIIGGHLVPKFEACSAPARRTHASACDKRHLQLHAEQLKRDRYIDRHNRIAPRAPCPQSLQSNFLHPQKAHFPDVARWHGSTFAAPEGRLFIHYGRFARKHLGESGTCELTKVKF